jgi:hypothetical protein
MSISSTKRTRSLGLAIYAHAGTVKTSVVEAGDAMSANADKVLTETHRFVLVGTDGDSCDFYVRLVIDENSNPLGAEVKRIEHIGKTVLERKKWLLSLPRVVPAK